MHSLAERVLFYVRRLDLLSPGERDGVAVSGGIDSVALLRLLLELRRELGIVPSVVHFNHKLRAESDADQEFVAGLAQEHGLEFYCETGDVAQHATEERVSIEAAARELRYAFFHRVLGAGGAQGLKPVAKEASFRGPEGPLFHGTGPGLDKILTGHTLDDQAETVLLRLIRGTGLRGLAGIHPRIVVEDENGNTYGEIVRPLLTTRRRDLQQYLNDIGQSWREDATNASTKFTRNRVRKLLLPVLESEFNPSVAENLAELAEIARGEEDYWENEIAGWMGTGVHWSEPTWARKSDLVQIGAGCGPVSPASETPAAALASKIEAAPWLVMNASVDRLWFLGEPLAVQRRVVKAIGEEAGIPLEFKHIEEILHFAAREARSGTEISLPLGWKVTRDPDQILFLTPDLRDTEPAQGYEYELTIPGEVKIHEIGSTIEVRRVLPDAGYNPDHLLDGDSLPHALKVRNWRAGDRFWPNHTKSPKKIKELLQERHVPHPERHLWPVVIVGQEIVWMRGFPVPAQFAAKPGREAFVLVERSIGSER